jgi:hypothetical protein
MRQSGPITFEYVRLATQSSDVTKRSSRRSKGVARVHGVCCRRFHNRNRRTLLGGAGYFGLSLESFQFAGEEGGIPGRGDGIVGWSPNLLRNSAWACYPKGVGNSDQRSPRHRHNCVLAGKWIDHGAHTSRDGGSRSSAELQINVRFPTVLESRLPSSSPRSALAHIPVLANTRVYAKETVAPTGLRAATQGKAFHEQSQPAVRLPKDFQFKTEEVFIRKEGSNVVLSSPPAN